MTDHAGSVPTDPDLADLVTELRDNGAMVELHADGVWRVLLFHRTTADAARAIRATGTMSGQEDGLFFSTRPDGQVSGYGPAVVRLAVPLDRVQLDDAFGDEAHVRVPLPRAGATLDVSGWVVA